MRAIRVHAFGGPEVLQLEDLPDPSPGAGQVLIRNEAAGVNPVDTYIRSGKYARLPDLPYTPGWDGAGTVEALGDGASGISVGDRVYFSGTGAGRSVGAYADLVVCRVDQAHPLPERLNAAQGAAIGVPYATAWRALHHRGQAQPGETVLVHGASGAVGLAAVQLARAHGLNVIGTAGSPEGEGLVRSQGAEAIRHGAPDSAAKIRSAAPHGVNLIIEMLANVNLDLDLSLLAMRGRVVVVGNRGRTEIDARQTMARDSSILGMSLWNASEAEVQEIHQRLAPGFADGTLTPVVWKTLPLKDAAQAHRVVLEGGARGKVVLEVGRG